MPQALDHDPPPESKLVPFGVLMLGSGLLTLIFGWHECSDFWGDCMKAWWTSVRSQCRGIRRLVIYLDNGPKNSGVTRKFLRRIVEFADWSGLEVRLVYYPPYHSPPRPVFDKYNPIERCWASLQHKWNGVLLTCWEVVRVCALRMTWRGEHLAVHHLAHNYNDEVAVTNAEMKRINDRLQRSKKLPKYDIIIKPTRVRGR